MTEKNQVQPEPGWNDPPYFSYEHTSYEQKNQSGGGSRINKRVVHTFSMPPAERHMSDSDAPPTGSPVDKPPPSLLIDKPPTDPIGSQQREETTEDEQITVDPDESLEVSLSDTLDNFSAVLEAVKAKNEKDGVEIKKRLDILEKMWMDGSFPKNVQQKIYSMSLALVSKNDEEVNRLQRILMVDHSRLCSSWMAAIRKLINAHVE